MSDLTYQNLVAAVTARDGAEDWYVLGCFLHDQRKWPSAAAAFAKVVERDPSNYKAWCNLGWNQHLSGRSGDGAESLERSLDLIRDRPTADEAATPFALLSQIRCARGQSQSAINYGREAVRRAPHKAINHMALAFALMSAGQWEEGWSEYEHRLPYKLPEFLTRSYPMWRGERVGTLFLEAEQGLGDALMGLRWVPAAMERCDRAVLYVHKDVYPVALHIVGGDYTRLRVLPLPQPFPEADAWVPMMSLPVALGAVSGADVEPYLEIA